MAKIYIIHQYESCEYGEYYGVYKVYLEKSVAEKQAKALQEADQDFDYIIEEHEVCYE